MQTIPTLVNQLQSHFLAQVRFGLDSCRYLSSENRELVRGLIASDASPRAVGDALFAGLADHWVENQMTLANSLNDAPSRPLCERSVHGVGRLFEPLPGSDLFPGSRPGRESFLAALAAERRYSAERVLELHYPMEVAEMIKPIGEDQLEGLHDHLSVGGLHLYGCEDSRISIRLSSLTAYETGLRIFNPRRAAKFCMTAGIAARDDLNELHRLGYHAIALPMAETPVHRPESEHPMEVALHDVFHAALWPVPWLRQSAVLFYDSLKLLDAENRERLEEQESLIQDLAVRNAEDLTAILERASGHLKPSTARFLLEDYLARLDSQFLEPGPHNGLRVIKSTIFQLLNRG